MVTARLAVFLGAAALTFVSVQPAHAQGDVLDLTPAVLDRFLTAFQKEESERTRVYGMDPATKAWWAREVCGREVRVKLDAAKDDATRDRLMAEGAKCDGPTNSRQAKYDACMADYAPKLDRLEAAYNAAQKKGDNATMKRIAAEAEPLVEESESKCGEDPEDNPGGIPEPQSEEEMNAASEAERELADKIANVDDQIIAAAAAAGQFTPRQYAIVRERVIAWFRQQTDPDSDSVRGYKFSAAEKAALSAHATRLRQAVRFEL
jgi:hypothetical protein